MSSASEVVFSSTNLRCQCTNMAAEKYDLVIYGATGFTGKLAVLHTANRYADTIRWAIAGRSKGKLDAVAANEGKGFCNIIVADSSKKVGVCATYSKWTNYYFPPF